MRKFIENTGFWLLVITCLALFAIIISGFFGIQRYLVVSGSMEPNLYAGDIVFVNTNIDFEDVEIGDVIIFKHRGMNIIHRVIEKTTTIDGNGAEFLLPPNRNRPRTKRISAFP